MIITWFLKTGIKLTYHEIISVKCLWRWRIPMFWLFFPISSMVIGLLESSNSFESNLYFMFLKNTVHLVHGLKYIDKALFMLSFHYLLIPFLWLSYFYFRYHLCFLSLLFLRHARSLLVLLVFSKKQFLSLLIMYKFCNFWFIIHFCFCLYYYS